MAYATVIVFWTFVEVVARNGLFKEIWVDPMNHVVEMSAVLAIFVVSIGGALVSSAPTKQELHQ